MNWSLLGIEPTKDKKTIIIAYRARLKQTNPEDKPEEFKALRAAYEEALMLAEQETEEPIRDESPVGLWMEQVRRLYDDFARRIQPENWVDLLADDICSALDTRPLAEAALLNFLTQDYFIPQCVWQVFDRTFSWTERKSELYESYPRDFVDYAVMNGIRYSGTLPYDLFTPGINGKGCDEYRRLYYQATQKPLLEAASILEEMNSLSEQHPYGKLLTYLFMIENGESEQGLSGCHKLAENYPQDAKLQLDWAAQCMNMSNWADGERYARRALALFSDSIHAKQMLATCLANQGQYESAKELLFQLMDAAGGDQMRINELHQMIQEWNENLIQDWESQLLTDSENMELRMKLAWCYLQNNKADEALALCQNIDPNHVDSYEYHNLFAKVSYSLRDYATALPHLQETEKILRTLVPDGTKETEKRLKSLPEKLQIQGSCLINLGDSEKAIEKYEQAVELAPENPEVLTHMGRLLCSLKKYDRATEIFEKLTNILPDAYHGFFLLAQTLFELGRDRDAFEAVNRALDLQGSDLGVYLLKMRILLRNGAWEGVRNILNFLHQNGITDEINTLWCEAQLLEQGENNKEQALELYRTLASRIENGEILEEASTLYFRLLCLEAQHLDANKAEDRKIMLEIAEKGLRHKEDDFSCLDYKAWLLKKDGQRKESLEIFHKLEAIPRRSMGIEAELAELYYQDLNQDADKAFHYYKLLLEQDEQPVYLFYAGTCCRYLNKYEEAEQYFLRLQEVKPESVDGYNGMSYLYDNMNRHADSLEQINKVIELIQTWEGNRSSYYYHKARILRRLNRPMEAITVIDELTEKYGNTDVFREKFEIYCQFGLWDQAAQILKEWKKSKNNPNSLAAASIDFDLFTGNIDKARRSLKKSVKNLEADDAERLTLLLAELDGDEDVQMSILEKKAEKRQEKSHELMNMAQVQWWNGHYDKAREYAQAALTQLEETIPRNKKLEALYRGRRSLMLAILGRFDEAVQELEIVRKLPLCETCQYCSCKDADIFEANMEEIRGNWENALKLHQKGSEIWPDDMDFVSGARRMMRKEK